MNRYALAFALTLIAAPAFAAPTIADGNYSCVLNGKTLGQINIAGDRYQGVFLDSAPANSEMFITMDPDRIEWLGSLGELDTAGYRVDHTVIRDGGFTLTLLTPDQSGFVDVACDLAP